MQQEPEKPEADFLKFLLATPPDKMQETLDDIRQILLDGEKKGWQHSPPLR